MNTARRLRFFGASLALLVVFASTMALPARADVTRTVLVLGDSISAAYGIQREQGWVYLLEAHLTEAEREWRTINASISGETTGGGLARLPALLEEHAPDVVLIELGGNDGLRGYPTDRLKRNLEQLVDLVEDSGAAAALMAMRIPPNYGLRYTRAFEQAFEEVADSRDVPLIPFFLEAIALEPGMMQSDGIHPTASAQPLMLDAVLPYLDSLLAGLEDS